MERFIKSIESSIESENWLAALFMALAMPDICRSVERPKIGKGETGKWYKDWVSRYLENKYPVHMNSVDFMRMIFGCIVVLVYMLDRIQRTGKE